MRRVRSSTIAIRIRPLLRTVKRFEAVKHYQNKMLKAMIDDSHHNMASYQTVREAHQASCTTTPPTVHTLALQEIIALTDRDACLEKINFLR